MIFESLNELVLSGIIVLASGAVCVLAGKYLKVHPVLAAVLFAWHTLLATAYNWYVLTEGGDPLNYFVRARFDYVAPSLGTDFIVWITSVPVSLGFPFMAVSYLFNFIGSLGLVFFAAALQDSGARLFHKSFGSILFALFLFIPSMSFWTSGIGKDSLAFLSVSLFLWSTAHLRRRQIAAGIAVLLMIPVRPHIAGIMLIAIVAGGLFAANLRASARVGLTAAAGLAAFFAVPAAMLYAGTGQFSTISDYITDRQEHNLGGGSSIDITGMNPAMRLLTFLYRPLPNEAVGADQLVASAENLLLIAVTLLTIVVAYRAGFVRVFRRYGIALTYTAGCVLLLSQVTANLGLATRQKWMALPALLFVALSAWQMFVEERSRNRALRQYRFIPVAGTQS